MGHVALTRRPLHSGDPIELWDEHARVLGVVSGAVLREQTLLADQIIEELLAEERRAHPTTTEASMGTRGIMGVRINGQDKLTYNHFDSYPSGLGNDMVKDIQKLLKESVSAFKAQAIALRMVDESSKPTADDVAKLRKFADEDVSSGSINEWYVLLRNLQGKLADMLFAGVAIDSHEFVKDSLFCEWGYIANLDDQTFEVYQGFQKAPHTAGRYAALPVQQESKASSDIYYPIALVAAIPFAELDDNWRAVLPKEEE